MAKRSRKPVSGASPILPISILPAVDPGSMALDNIRLNSGEVLVVSIDANGNEGTPFRVNEHTYNAYYQDKSRFILKKKQ